ncbi:protein FAM131C isoform X2 [Dunckerocampus dactyliophorus]|uniref:protein FAM131C isoform X2 n=1 Tax=Dunckerocampus dactyliophorus TaxID=161453 RepID=UPI0024062EAA|nr:protein FAM131C isoform X2 [Dunckerocampus dactyliophorus]
MGSCLCKAHKELHYPMTVIHEGHPADPTKDGQAPSNGTAADKSEHYGIGELATSSLLGLVATIKEHITKPTAMAQGRVAHLIEWKGWGGGGGVGGRGGGKAGGGGSWGAVGAELQEDEQFYSQMTDEIKEARFAAGVAEQFALAEAAMTVWSMNDSLEQPSTSLHAQSPFLSHFLLDGGSVGVPQHLYSIHAQTYSNSQLTGLVAPSQPPPPPMASISPTSIRQQERISTRTDKCTVTAEATVRHIDSSSLSEDDVFYN